MELKPKFWAKTTADGEAGISVYGHCLNVGFSAKIIAIRMPHSLRELSPLGAILLIAAHDIGKISTGFAVKCPAWISENGLSDRAAQWGWEKSESNHAAVSQDFVWGRLPTGKAKQWAVAVGGHHGRFLGNGKVARREMDQGFTAQAREELFAELVRIFGPLPDAPPKSDAQLLFVSGWMTVADWIGSNEAFFPLLAEYDPEISKQRADAALEVIRWNRGRLKAARTFAQLFSSDVTDSFCPNTLQQLCLEEIKSPGLHVIEAPMGCGKTEAALSAAYQLIEGGHHHGIYFALPTQLTSNRIHQRVEAFLLNALDEETDHPLAHSNSWLQRDLQIHLRPSHAKSSDCESPRAHAREARSWFASSKQALLARHGVGTIDQALLGAVAAKYCAVRLFGLAGKVVILDEVHSYDAYMSRLIDALIARLLELQCSVIVLSATLTHARRAELLCAAGAKEPPNETAYPLVTSIERDGTVQFAKPQLPDLATPPFEIAFRPPDDESVFDEALEAAEQGACVLVIRNTVDAAQDTFHAFRSQSREGGPAIGLLHSRFPQFRRGRIERKWMLKLGIEVIRRWQRRFANGDSGKFPKRRGCVLVATQVVEQSVDIDADLLVTDLAPTDMLLQRMGRLWRHARGTRPVRMPRVCILAAVIDGITDPKRIHDALGKSSFVYPPYVLLRTGEVWRKRNTVSLPRDIRELLEATYAYRPTDDEPDGWAHWRGVLERRTNEMENTALTRTHIFGTVPLKDEEGVQTRWNDFPTANLLLLAGDPVSRSDGETELAFINGQRETASHYEWRFPVAAAIHRNLVRVPLYAVRAAIEGDAGPDWLRLHTHGATVLGIVNADDGTIDIADNSNGMALEYHAETGVRIRRTAPVSAPQPSFEDDDESWF